jgi:hypothetical protein
MYKLLQTIILANTNLIKLLMRIKTIQENAVTNAGLVLTSKYLFFEKKVLSCWKSDWHTCHDALFKKTNNRQNVIRFTETSTVYKIYLVGMKTRRKN